MHSQLRLCLQYGNYNESFESESRIENATQYELVRALNKRILPAIEILLSLVPLNCEDPGYEIAVAPIKNKEQSKEMRIEAVNDPILRSFAGGNMVKKVENKIK